MAADPTPRQGIKTTLALNNSSSSTSGPLPGSFLCPCSSAFCSPASVVVIVLLFLSRLSSLLLLSWRSWFCSVHTEQARAAEVSGVRRDASGRMMPRPRGSFGRYCPGQPGAAFLCTRVEHPRPTEGRAAVCYLRRSKETGYTPRTALKWAETSLLHLFYAPKNIQNIEESLV